MLVLFSLWFESSKLLSSFRKVSFSFVFLICLFVEVFECGKDERGCRGNWVNSRQLPCPHKVEKDLNFLTQIVIHCLPWSPVNKRQIWKTMEKCHMHIISTSPDRSSCPTFFKVKWINTEEIFTVYQLDLDLFSQHLQLSQERHLWSPSSPFPDFIFSIVLILSCDTFIHIYFAFCLSSPQLK